MTDGREYVLYILMRTDIGSLAGGKGMAQASHATSLFETAKFSGHMEAHRKYWRLNRKFGTTIVLSVDGTEELSKYIDEALERMYPAASVNDPTFPIRDGKVIFELPVRTCGYIFAPQNCDFLQDLELYPTFL